MSTFFDQSFWQNVVSNVGGVFIGAALALYADSRRSNHDLSEARKAEGSRLAAEKEKVFAALSRAIEHNGELARQATKLLTTPGQTPTFSMDAAAVGVLVPRVLDVSRDYDLVSEITNYRFQLDHLGRKLDALFDLDFGIGQSIGGYPQRRGSLISTIVAHTSVIEALGMRIKEQVDR